MAIVVQKSQNIDKKRKEALTVPVRIDFQAMRMKKSNKPLKDHVPDFIAYCRLERGLAESTLKNYSHSIKRFILSLEENNRDGILPHELTQEDVWEYRVYLSECKTRRGKPLKKESQRYHLTTLRSFLEYLCQRDILSLPKSKVGLPKKESANRKIKFLELDQVRKLLEEPDLKTQFGLRNRAILETLFSTGLRVSELVSLNRDQFQDIENKEEIEITVTGKGSKTRTVYFSKRATCWLKKYLSEREDDKKVLFLSNKLNTEKEGRLHPRSIQRMIKKYAESAELPSFVTPHTLRHSFATDLLNQGADLRVIQELLGHSDVSTTQIYTHVTNKKLKNAHQKYHSGSRL